MEHPCDRCEGFTAEEELQFVNDEWLCAECVTRLEVENTGEEWKGEVPDDDDDPNEEHRWKNTES